MPTLAILGAGTAGTLIANKLATRLDETWEMVVVDESTEHHYQPGYLFVPFGHYTRKDLVRPIDRYLPARVERIKGRIQDLDPEGSLVELEDGRALHYDQLVIATGSTPRPDETPGMAGPELGRSVHHFYTLEGAEALERALYDWDGGRLVVHMTEMPIKCPVAPLEFAFLVEDHLRDRGMRERTELTYVTPLPGAFTKPVASATLGHLFEDRGIAVESDFVIERVDEHAIVSYDERSIPFDLLVTVPVNMGADFVGRSGLGDELNYVKVDPATFQSTHFDNIFALGDAADLPTSKAGSVAHFAAEVFIDNFLEHIAGRPMTHAFDGHATCFVETGGGKALLIDFDYEHEPLPGNFPFASVGPLKLLEETRLNHIGKMAFRGVYWNALIKGRPIPLPHHRTGHMPDESNEQEEVTV